MSIETRDELFIATFENFSLSENPADPLLLRIAASSSHATITVAE
jgi:hypothetical protein